MGLLEWLFMSFSEPFISYRRTTFVQHAAVHYIGTPNELWNEGNLGFTQYSKVNDENIQNKIIISITEHD